MEEILGRKVTMILPSLELNGHDCEGQEQGLVRSLESIGAVHETVG